jgi:branched-chain amino acid transport system ATP-binding protein
MTDSTENQVLPVLECQALTKRFGGLEAVKEIDLKINPGERRAIIGPNGAGKTTFFSLISGEIEATSGSIRIFGQDCTRMPPYKRTAIGLGRTFQITNLFNTMTVMDNLLLAAIGLKRLKYSLHRKLSSYKDVHAHAQTILESVGMADKGDVVITGLSYGEQRQIEIALALVSNPRILLLDEPTAGLSPADSAMMAGMIHNLDPALTILIIEHNMDVAFQVADCITVLHQGAVFAEGCQPDISNNAQVQEIYFGAE